MSDSHLPGGLEAVLAEWESIVNEQFPDLQLDDFTGLDDAGIETLKAAIAPLMLPTQVETLYRWRNGTDSIFAGWRLRPVEELLSWREFCIGEMGEPPAWLQLFDDQCLGFVTLGVPGTDQDDQSVWYGHTHDTDVNRICNSIAAMVLSCVDAARAGELTVVDGRLATHAGEGLDGLEFSRFRLHRNPGTHVWPDPPEGTQLARLPEPNWPRPWLVSLGVDAESSSPRGATHTIAQLVGMAATSPPASGTIRGQVVRLVAVGDVWTATVEDSTGALAVSCEPAVTVFTPAMSQHVEIDVVVTAAAPPTYDLSDKDPAARRVMQRFLPDAPPAVATAVRPLPDVV